MKKVIIVLFIALAWSCNTPDSETDPLPNIPKDPDNEVLRIPVVVHVMHNGEEYGVGPNLSNERIIRQIEILNEDFRRREGTRGFNDHPEGADAHIEFVLASTDPQGNPTSGIVRRQFELDELPSNIPNLEFERYAFFSYWGSSDYINIWTAPYPNDYTNIILGQATGPDTDLPGDKLFQKPLTGGAEGIVINWAHFGESDIEGGRNLGRTLTHEMGHYLGLLHTWGARDCEANDYCEDTPAVNEPVTSSEPYIGCDGEEVMIGNYMNYTSDEVMNIFTKDQVSRMRYVLRNSPRRVSLLNSEGL